MVSKAMKKQMEGELENETKNILVRNLEGDEIRKACDKVLEAVRLDDVKKMKRYLNRYANDLIKVSTD